MTQYQKQIIWLTIELLDEVNEIIKDHCLKNQLEFIREELFKMIS